MILGIALYSVLLVAGPSVGSSNTEAIEVQLAGLAKDEMAIVARLQSLRKATERLPADWKTERGNSEDKKVYTRNNLLGHLDRLELMAAERWSLLIQNLATMKTPTSQLTEEDLLWRKDLERLPNLHMRINRQLDQFNAILKDGILLNLAKSLQAATSVD